MSDDMTGTVQQLAATTGVSSADIREAVEVLKAADALLPEPWTDETIARALPGIIEMAACGRMSVGAVAAGLRATTALRPGEEPTT